MDAFYNGFKDELEKMSGRRLAAGLATLASLFPGSVADAPIKPSTAAERNQARVAQMRKYESEIDKGMEALRRGGSSLRRSAEKVKGSSSAVRRKLDGDKPKEPPKKKPKVRSFIPRP